MRVRFALGMYILSCLCRFCLRWVPNTNILSGGILAFYIVPGTYVTDHDFPIDVLIHVANGRIDLNPSLV